MSTLRFGSLFSGIGGFDLGLERAGWECAWQVENDKDCQGVLERRWAEVPRCGDITEVKGGDIGPVDLVCGGFPCQDLSVAGRRAGLAGERSGLWFEFRRILAELRPRWVVIENVPGLLSSQGGSDFAVILGGLAELGYMGAWRVLDAQHFGVPQRRRRVFVVGHLGDGRRAAEVLFESEGSAGDLAPSGEARQDVAGTLGGGSGSRGTDDPDRMTFVPSVADTLRSASDGPSRGKVNGTDRMTFVVRALTAHPNGHRLDGESDNFVVGGGSWPTVTKDLTPSVTGRRADQTAVVTHALTSEGADASEDGTGRGTPLTVASVSENQRAEVREPPYSRQLTSGGGKPGQGYPAVRQGMQVRRLTPTECERLQGFPDGWTAPASDSARYRQLGNAAAVPVIAWIGHRIALVEGGA